MMRIHLLLLPFPLAYALNFQRLALRKAHQDVCEPFPALQVISFQIGSLLLLRLLLRIVLIDRGVRRPPAHLHHCKLQPQ